MENLPGRDKEKEEGGGRKEERWWERERERGADVTFVGRIWRRIDARERRRCNPTEGHRTARGCCTPAAATTPLGRPNGGGYCSCTPLLQLRPNGEIITGVATGRRPPTAVTYPPPASPSNRPSSSSSSPRLINILLIRTGDNAC